MKGLEDTCLPKPQGFPEEGPALLSSAKVSSVVFIKLSSSTSARVDGRKMNDRILKYEIFHYHHQKQDGYNYHNEVQG